MYKTGLYLAEDRLKGAAYYGPTTGAKIVGDMLIAGVKMEGKVSFEIQGGASGLIIAYMREPPSNETIVKWVIE